MNTQESPRATSHASRFTFYVSRFAPLATILLAFFLRLYRLADKNIWWDEGWSIWLAKQDFVAIALRTAADEHPPLHYWMLKLWTPLFGSSAFAGRFLSVAFGVLTIALLYRIGKRVGGSWVGILAAFILAVSRFHIWWSQDIKNYTPSIFFAFAAVWFAIKVQSAERQVMRNDSRPSGLITQHSLLYALFAALAMFTHYLAALVLLVLNLYVITFYVLRFRKKSLLVIGNWLIANALAAALFAPWLYLYLQNAQSWVAAPAFDFTLFLKLVATVLPLGVTTDIDNYFWLMLAFTALAVVGGLWSAVSRRSLFSAHWLLFTLIVAFPPILIYALSLTPAAFFAPKIQARYLLILAPAYAILIALGISNLSRLSRYFAPVATLFLLAASIFVLRDYYAERRLTDDYATMANTVNAFARQGDLVLLDTDQEWPTFLYYLRAPLDWLGVPNGASMNDANADSTVKRVLNRYGAVWLVTIPDALATDPPKLVEARLGREWKKQFEKTFGDKRLTLYAPDPRDLTNVTPQNFAPQFKMNNGAFLGFDLPVREANAGDTVRVVTYWNAPSATRVEIKLGQVSATEKIGMGERSRVESDLVLPPNAAGDLPLTVNQIEIARIHVEPRTSIASTGKISHPTNYALGSIRLVGYDLPQTQVRATDQLPITIYWSTEQSVNKNYVVFVHILGSEFNAAQNNFLWGQLDRVPAVPPTAWQPSQTVADAYRVPIAPNAPPGKYKIEVGMYDAATGARLRLNDGADSIILAEIEIR